MNTTLNGQPFTFDPHPTATAVEVIREEAGLTGTKISCGGGICGACTVLVDGVPTCSCLMPANHMEGKAIQTIEQHGRDNLHPVQKAFMANEGLQCGFCTPGFVNEGIAFYEKWRTQHGDGERPEPSHHEVALAMGGHLCRCAAYVGIYASIQQACAGKFDDASVEVTAASVPRMDALEKVTGEAKYTVDIKMEGQLEGKILRSAHPHANVKSIDSAAAMALDGVVAVENLMDGRRVRYVGQPIAGVAAVDERTAEAALKLIKVDYEVLPAVIGIDAAMQPTSPEVFADDKSNVPSSAEGFTFRGTWQNNVRRTSVKPTTWRPAAARRKVAHAQKNRPNNVVAETYRNEQQVHNTLEPHATVAYWDGPDKLVTHVSSQSVHALRKELAEHFDLDKEQVSVNSQYIGGGFGGKAGMYNETIAAVTLAKCANAPVRVANDRIEELSYSALRPGGITEAAIVTSDDGAPEALTLNAFGDGGVAIGTLTAGLYGFMSPRVLRDLEDSSVVNNATAGTAFRGPDAPLTFWAMEQLLDDAAQQRNLSPTEMHRQWKPNHEIRYRLLNWVEAIPAWQERGSDVASDNGRFKRGLGLSMPSWMFIYNPDVQVTVSSSPAGIKVSNATQDIGNGTRTSLSKAVEDCLGIDRHEVIIEIGRADLPLGPVAGGSQVTTSVYPTTYKATEEVRDHLVKEAGSKLGLKNVKATKGGVNHADGFTPWSDILAKAERFSYTDKRGTERGPLGFRLNLSGDEDAPALGMRLGHAAIVTEIEVDTRLGKIRPTRVWKNIAVGKIFVPELARSQVYGGVIQGLGYALYEQKQYDLETGFTLSSNMNDYRIPGIGDVPEIVVDFDEKGYEEIRGQGIGLAELATIGMAASVGNAVYHATGWRPLKTPITPADVLTGLQGMKSQEVA
ncbi:MAG: molybdopterin-dependent oxidoreductase [Chloroflexota bacterium]